MDRVEEVKVIESRGAAGARRCRPAGRPARNLAAAAAVAVLLAAAAPADAAVRFFRLQSREAFLAGTPEGIAVDPLGTLALADRAVRAADLGEPFVFSGAAHPEGWVVGTGNAGKVLLVDRAGKTRILFAAPEPEIFAVWVDADGTVFAGSSPDGKVYRIADGRGEVFFDPEETYIWALGRGGDGGLLVATGTQGKLYRVDAAGRGEVLFDSEDTHIRALQTLPGGDVVVGTAGEGLILRIARDGSARTLYDADQPEVVSFALGPDGSCYAALLASEASLVEVGKRGGGKGADRAAGEQAAAAEEGGAVTVTMTPAAPEQAEVVGSRPAGFKGPRSEVVRITPEARIESLWRFDEETVYGLLWHRERLWVGTGLKGKLFSFQQQKMVLEKDVDERQVVTLLDDRPGPAFGTTNAAALYRITADTERRGTYTSPTLDAGEISEFGSLRWQGELPKGTGLEFSFRSGISSEPDATWTAWSAPARGREVPLEGVAPGRYLQWRAAFSAADGRSPALSRVEVSYRQLNLAPRIAKLDVLDPGEILVPANFNPANQVFEPAHPDRQGIFTTLEIARPRDERRLKTLWKKGFRTLRWDAEDPNDDTLTFELAFRPEGGDREWLPIVEELEESAYSFDSTVLPDGDYRFRLRATDRTPSDLEPALVAEEISEPVVVDHTPPRLASVKLDKGGFLVEAFDASNPLREAVFSVDAKEWRPARPVDGILDGRRELLAVEATEGASLVLLRLTDAAFNVVTFDLSAEVR